MRAPRFPRLAEAPAGLTPEHQQLFEQLDRVVRSATDSRSLERELVALQDAVRQRFGDEEARFEQQAYPRSEEHRQVHATYLRDLQRMREEGMGPAGVAYLRAWLVNHAHGDDRAWAEWLSSREKNLWAL